MNIFKRIVSIFSGGASSDNRLLHIYALNTRCKEPVTGTVDLYNELSHTDEGEYPLYVRKVLHTTGAKRCFGQTEVELWFDTNKQLKHYDVQGGRWLDADAYAVELARFEAPPAE
ncbi:MAG: hypothetical protein R3A44_16635 [Caldilineaceae bacterium]